MARAHRKLWRIGNLNYNRKLLCTNQICLNYDNFTFLLCFVLAARPPMMAHCNRVSGRIWPSMWYTQMAMQIEYLMCKTAWHNGVERTTSRTSYSGRRAICQRQPSRHIHISYFTNTHTRTRILHWFGVSDVLTCWTRLWWITITTNYSRIFVIDFPDLYFSFLSVIISKHLRNGWLWANSISRKTFYASWMRSACDGPDDDDAQLST